MSGETGAERIVAADGQAVSCRFFRPARQDDGSCLTRYEIDRPEQMHTRIRGFDGAQSLLLAMQTAHIDLLVARAGRAGGDIRGSPSLPIADTVRDKASESRL